MPAIYVFENNIVNNRRFTAKFILSSHGQYAHVVPHEADPKY